MKTAADVNAELIEAIIIDHMYRSPERSAAALARKIVEAIPELRPHQQEMLPDGTTRPIVAPLPWAHP